jgi:hypothetical protein
LKRYIAELNEGSTLAFGTSNPAIVAPSPVMNFMISGMIYIRVDQTA